MSDEPTNAPAAGKHANTGLYVKGRNGVRLRDQRVRKMVQKLRAAMGNQIADSDIPVARAWCAFEILCVTVFAELRKGVIKNGEARRLLNDYRLLRQTQLGFARELGLKPAARITIQNDPKKLRAADVELTEEAVTRAIEIGNNRNAATSRSDESDDPSTRLKAQARPRLSRCRRAIANLRC
jgi:hypothetical protein